MKFNKKRHALTLSAVVAFFVIVLIAGVRGSRIQANQDGVTEVSATARQEAAPQNAVVAAVLANSAQQSAPLLAESVSTSTELPIAVLTATNTPTTGLAASVVNHIKTPEAVRAAYLTACYASQKALRARVVDLIESTKLNAVVIDVKDYTGYTSYDVGDARFSSEKAPCEVSDMKEFLAELGEKNIYRIARITVMQDPKFASEHPSKAVQSKSGGVWKDKKGLAFIDPADREFWQHIRDLSLAVYASGFDEINFDYVRFPTDGDLKNASFVISEKVAKDVYRTEEIPAVTKIVKKKDVKTGITSTSTVVVKPATTKKILVKTMKSEVMKSFFEYIGGEMRKSSIPTSVDLFGLVTTTRDDLGIGQVLEDAIPNFDYIAPMVYPSHYPRGAFGYNNPNLVPGQIVDKAMAGGVARAKAMGYGPSKFRTWIQDFSYGGNYGASEILAQIAGSEKNGVMSYMVWDPKNKYTGVAYK